MSQGGLKHAATDSRLDSKRERRRGAAGRASVLRRAPSDSDCSGETASLSADSGDRAVRPVPPPVRTGKSRSRRRGSEWEVLEGLKDGQRFEKRPDVFNGYLHKKRKWPLKGWHKRYFVVDGGILVYARSPTDVARGRLHGSVDVGLSVISAKARRRRIDIDADEFIYHLRAKTPDVFRTWLNVLKAHRLYRQHLLTFGARESVPKIHAPLDDLPPTDTSSRSSCKTETSAESTSSEDSIVLRSTSVIPSEIPICTVQPNSSINKYFLKNFYKPNTDTNSLTSFQNGPSDNKSDDINSSDTFYDAKYLTDETPCKVIPDYPIVTNYNTTASNTENMYLFNNMNEPNAKPKMKHRFDQNASLCNEFNSAEDTTSDKSNNNDTTNTQQFESIYVATELRQRSQTNLDILRQIKENTFETDSSMFRKSKMEPTSAYYFFARRKYHFEHMKRSKKSTNLVKYKNILDEPKLQRPLSKCMLLGKLSTVRVSNKEEEKSDEQFKKSESVHVVLENKEFTHASMQDTMSVSEYSDIVEKILLSLFENNNPSSAGSRDYIKSYVNKIVEELYEVKLHHNDIHPIKILFRCLLEFWLKNNTKGAFQNVTQGTKSSGPSSPGSNSNLTVDKNISSIRISLASRGTQYRLAYGFKQPQYRKGTDTTSKLVGKPPKVNRDKVKPPCHSPRRDTESFEKERRIQELERLLKNTVYLCENVRSLESKEKDVRITKTLMDNIGMFSEKSNFNTSDDVNESSSSAEIPKIQETINHLISDTQLPADVAKDFLNAYLGVLDDKSRSATGNSTSRSDTIGKPNELDCDVQTEAVRKKLSKSILTDNKFHVADVSVKDKSRVIDPGQQYLKDILDKVTTIFSKINMDRGQKHNDAKTKAHYKPKDELGRSVKEYPGKNLVREDYDSNSVIIDLSKYNLEHISMFSDPEAKGVMSITIKVKEKPQNHGEAQRAHLNLKFSDEALQTTRPEPKSWVKISSSSSSRVFDSRKQKCNRDVIDFNCKNQLKSYLSSCEIGSKAYCRIVHESEHSLDLSFKSSKYYQHLKNEEKKNEDPQPCYIMSFQKKKIPSSPTQVKKKVRLKECHGLILNSLTNASIKHKSKYPDEYSVFENPAPKIIDEKFILLLLENLTFLSKDIPALYKDINGLYLKLKKKHEKVVKNCINIQGLSLLGKIYNEDNGDMQTEPCSSSRDMKKTRHVATNTSYVSDKRRTIQTNTSNVMTYKTNAETNTSHILNVSASTNTSINENFNNNDGSPCPKKNTRNAEMLTEAFIIEIKSFNKFECSRKSFVLKDSSSSTQTVRNTASSREEVDLTDQATSGPDWHKKLLTKDCGVTTVIKCILNNSADSRQKKFGVKDLEISAPLKRKKELLQGVKRDFVSCFLSTHFKAPTPSQTERKLHSDAMDHVLQMCSNLNEKDFDYVSECSEVQRWRSEIKLLYKSRSEPSLTSGLVSPSSPLRAPQAGFVSGTPGGRLAGWIIESGGPLENASRELGQAQLSVQQLQRLLDALELQQQVHHDTDVSLEGASPNVKKDRRKFGLRKKKSNSKCASVELTSQHIDPSTSHMALSALTAPPSPGGGASSIPNSAASLPIACAAARPQSLPGAEALAGHAAGPASLTSLTPDHQLREDFTVLAKDLVASLKTIVSTLVCERGRLRAAMEATDATAAPPGAVVAALRTNLTSALQQNSELRTRLSRIHDASDLAEISTMERNDSVVRQFQQSLSYSSSCVSASEFFDAEEHEDEAKPETIIQADEAGVIELDGDSSSEAGSLSSEEGSASSDNSDGAMPSVEQPTLRLNQNGISESNGAWCRRTRLPCPRPTPGGPSLWNLLYKNIGKDLSQVSMPVTINEPLNMLQRLCEELEYSELLDAAAECAGAAERLSLVAAFAVSAYASSAHRAASKPFNPLLAETYECCRDDKGFRFIAEQVSHHPPISACHAESSRWRFWQEARIKTKFWGKSMEFQPAGRVHVMLLSTGDHYSWNKVTTCVHNLFGGQRWVDQYGDMHITCHGTDITCKLNFIKASSWSSTRHEVRGAVLEGSGARTRIAGRWSEALHAGEPPAARCLWRPGAMPPEHELYYGFTRFAMELNEMEPGMRDVLPYTDTRLRPDQRALEEGDVDAAERHKLQLEQAQRERRRDAAGHQPAWFRKASEGGEEVWVFTGEYWKARSAGFPGLRAPRIW